MRDSALAECLDRARRRIGIPLPPPRPLIRIAGAPRLQPKRERPTIVAATHNLERQGAPLSLIEVLAGLAANFDVHLTTPSFGPLTEDARAAGIAVHATPLPQLARDGASYDAGLRTYAELVSSLQPDVVMANSTATFHAVDAARLLGVPSIWVIRESTRPAEFFAQFPRSVQARALGCLEYPRQLVFVSQHTMARWPESEVPRTVIHTVLEPTRMQQMIDAHERPTARASLGYDGDDIVFLTIGTLCDDKGQADLLDALPSIVERAPRARFLLVGSAAEPGGARLIERLRELDETSRARVSHYEATADIAQFYCAADFYLCTSRRESYPRTILEAKGLSLSVLAPAIDGVLEILTHEEGSIFDQGDPSDLARSAIRAAHAKQHCAASAINPPTVGAYYTMLDRYRELIRSSTR